MDPDAALADLRENVNAWLADPDNPKLLPHLAAVAAGFDALDSFLSRGGFLPAAWLLPRQAR